MNLILPTAG